MSDENHRVLTLTVLADNSGCFESHFTVKMYGVGRHDSGCRMLRVSDFFFFHG